MRTARARHAQVLLEHSLLHVYTCASSHVYGMRTARARHAQVLLEHSLLHVYTCASSHVYGMRTACARHAQVLLEHSLLQGSIRDGVTMHDLLRTYAIAHTSQSTARQLQRDVAIALSQVIACSIT